MSEEPKSPGGNGSDVVKKNFAEQLLMLRRQQEEQYHRLTQQYKQQQNMLRQQQQQELKQHYKRQMILNPSNKMTPQSMTAHDGLYRGHSDPGERDNDLMKEPAPMNNAFSAHVRDRVRKKALENINKKNSFQQINPNAFATNPPDDFKRWAFESRAYSQSEDNELIPLRKAASEPNLKGRNPFKHRVRFKPCMDAPSHVRHSYSPNESRYSEERRDERREAISPPYIKPHIEGKIFSQGPRVPPLFQSPSLPNINLDSKRSQLHFPTLMSTISSYSSDSSPDLKAPLEPDHPKYLDMLKTQYATNHRYLQHIMQERDLDPKEIDIFHQRYLAKSDTHTLSDEQRVKQLLESQNRLYLHLTEMFGMSPTYAESSKSLSKLAVDAYSPSFSTQFNQSRSHDSLQNIKVPSKRGMYYEQTFSPPSRMRYPSDVYSNIPSAPLFKSQQPVAARMRLKAHLREKQDVSIMRSVSMEEHFHRLEKEHRIQEETEEDVAKEASEISDNKKMFGISENEAKLNPKLSSDSSSRLHGSDSRLARSEKLHRSINRLHGSDSKIHCMDQRANFLDGNLSGSRLFGSDSHIMSSSSMETSSSNPVKSAKTGLVYDTIMLKHQCSCGKNFPIHPESPGRLQSIWARLQETGVANLCERIRPRKATLAELQTVHSEQHAVLFGGGARKEGIAQNLRCFSTLDCGGIGVDSSTVWNETHTSNAARMAAGCVIELAFKVATNELRNGFAIVRPPGHHAETHQAMGFCYFNSVAIAAKLLCIKMAVERVLILDWDIHHGNGTQQMFYDDDRVLFISMHRHDDCTFFPGTGKAEECGAGIGVGCNINIPFDGGLDPVYGDAEYLAAFRAVVIPIVKEYKPDIILVSAGFDAAKGHSHQLGGYNVSAACFSYMTKQMMKYANGKLVLALEGGYALQSLCDASENCIRALLGGSTVELSDEVKQQKPNSNAVRTLQKVVDIQGRFWPSLKRLSTELSSSFNSAVKIEKEEADTVNALASLSMQAAMQSEDSKAASDKIATEPMEES